MALKKQNRPKRVSLINLGCPKNRVDGERQFAQLACEGFALSSPEESDLLLINTCAFIRPAVQESLFYIRQAARRKREGKLEGIVVMGCLPERVGESLKSKFPEIDQLIFKEIPCNLEEKEAPRVLTTFPYAFLKIAEGCNRECSFCLIPELRGKYRSLDPAFLLKEAWQLREMGVQELVLVAQDTTFWGIDREGKPLLLDLIEGVSRIGFPWVRLLYLHPQLVNRNFLLSFRSIPGVVPYLDLPLQHVDSRILSMMKRGYGERETRQVISSIRELWPEAAIRATFIVGFPGEGEREFKKLLNFIEESEFDRLAVFPFFPEEGTVAKELPHQVGEREKKDRFNQVIFLQREIYRKKNRMLVGKRETVLIDRQENGLSIGRTFRDAPEVDLTVKIKETLPEGSFKQARITKANIYSLIGETDKEGGDGN
ncbi:MAG: 30S ribosomal protein S12 methylthiotransferase RimO [Caldiserica bacterium]|jgi:ribosomal protein S12 methylthiotransferase|nr:30S ribosomal protein S12 methylthiotransferase RimO [Caldisericota bacterium]MDH7562863.1 30S ribosomal protein S12 methylthiotransferase RimO [Caldisericota bacterium]